MSVLRALTINALLSLPLLFCLLNYTNSMTEPPRSTTSSTIRPWIRTPGLSLPRRDSYPPKCYREVPAVFFQFEKDIQIVGNSTTNPYFNIIEICCKGYKRYDFDWSRCVPDCGNRCHQNGFCVDGGVCQCFDEFVLNYRNVCVPICPLGCPDGQCYLNGTCICNYGYELDPTKKYCMPKCTFGCGHNEICTDPGRCECAEGFTRAPKSMDPASVAMGCQPICIPGCGYGHCVGPNECECFQGYQKRLNGTVCESNCYKRCENGFCANRTTCICQNGYNFDHNSTSCLPDCKDECENGICISPGVCRCFNGYVRKGVKCEAICEKGCGFNGKCIAPNVCGCAIVEGPYKSYQKCQYGYCNARGSCRCQEGMTRFIDQCMSPDKVTTYATVRNRRLNETLMDEFDLLIGNYFNFGIPLPRYYSTPNLDPLSVYYNYNYNFNDNYN